MPWKVPQLFADRPVYKTNAREFPYRKPVGLIWRLRVGDHEIKYFFNKKAAYPCQTSSI